MNGACYGLQPVAQRLRVPVFTRLARCWGEWGHLTANTCWTMLRPVGCRRACIFSSTHGPSRRSSVRNILSATAGATRLWCYAPGYFEDHRVSQEGMRQLTGFSIKRVKPPKALGFPTEAGKRLGLTKQLGVDSPVEPLFAATDALAARDACQLSRRVSSGRATWEEPVRGHPWADRGTAPGGRTYGGGPPIHSKNRATFMQTGHSLRCMPPRMGLWPWTPGGQGG